MWVIPVLVLRELIIFFVTKCSKNDFHISALVTLTFDLNIAVLVTPDTGNLSSKSEHCMVSVNGTYRTDIWCVMCNAASWGMEAQ